MDALLRRKGAPRIALIPPEVLQALNEGRIPTVNLNEFLALDLGRLAVRVAEHVGLDPQAERLQDTLAMLPALAPMKRHLHVARAFHDLAGSRPDRDAVAQALAAHPSDAARGWAAQWVAFAGLPLADRLAAVRRFAADPHFGVREMAWMAVRDAIAADVDAAVRLLQPWTREAIPACGASQARAPARAGCGARRSPSSRPSPGAACRCWSPCAPTPAATCRIRWRTG